jgi:HEAT repeat protein
MSLAAASAGAPPAEASADTSGANAPVPALEPVPAAASAPAPGLFGGRSTAVWMAAASLCFSAVLVYVFQQRVDELHSADTGLARGIEQSSSRLRTLDAELGRLPAQTAELEQRLTQKLEQALASSEKQRGELAAATQRADESLADLQHAITDLRRELETGAKTREQRLDEISHRLAAGEDAQRELTGRLGEFQKSAESARAAAEAAAKALPEKPAPAGPSWNSLLPNLADANPSTRWEAVDELGRSKDTAVIPHLLPLLKDSDLFVRMCVARVLADLGTLQGVPSLIDALEDAEPTVRESAWNALRTLTGKDFKYDPQGNEADRQKKVKSWREWWKKEGEGLLNGGSAPDGKQPAVIKSGTQKS